MKALDEQSVQFRTSDDINIGGLYFSYVPISLFPCPILIGNSTFFGGDDSSWATPQTVHTYFRNIQLWGSSDASNLSGPTISAAWPVSLGEASRWLLAVFSATGIALLGGLF